jgi:phosphatidate cytidylyltransferase
MSDEGWRERRDPDDFSEYGSLFDEAEPTQDVAEVDPRPKSEPKRPDQGDDGPIDFGDSDTGSLPHWTEPPTGEVPRLDPDTLAGVGSDDDEELDVWSSFSSEAPVWKDDLPDESVADDDTTTPGIATPGPGDGGQHGHTVEGAASGWSREEPDRGSGRHDRVSGPQPQVSGPQERISGQQRRVTGESAAIPAEPSRITIGTDPSGMPRRPVDPRARGGRVRSGPPSGAATKRSGRDMPLAIGVGILLAGVFLAAFMYSPLASAVLVVAVLGLGAVEFYDKVSEKGYRPAVVPGVLTCIAAPTASYWLGVGALPLVIAFGFMATAGSFIGARGVEAGPLPNVSITTLGIVWIGILGSFATLILRLSTREVSQIADVQALAENRGTDTLVLLAIGVVANDVGALFIGSAVGNTPLRRWISPNKTVEGLIGGALFTICALMFVGLTGRSDTWVSNWHLLALALVVSAMAPMGDLVESMFKRNLDVKDFGSIVRGHGGVLDRFDGFLFTLPAVYYLTLVLEPWTKFNPVAT